MPDVSFASVSTEKQRFTIRASASRLEKGLLAIPQRFNSWFPAERVQVKVIFDDEEKTRALTFHPYDATVKESRIFGLAQWFSKRNVREGDLISVTVEDPGDRLYRITLDRYVRERQEQRARQQLEAASTDSEAAQQLSALSRLTRRRPRELARDELMRLARESQPKPRPRVPPGAAEQHEGVPPGIRIMLRELHDGKCQLCSFTFEKRNGEPYFEIHHLDPDVGHHPRNLLVVCPNCHAQFEHAAVAEFKWADNWLVGVVINGKSVAVRQPLAQDSIRRALVGLGIVVAVGRIRRLLR
jgi:5-methylcytosine-specific restriction endonuclease McrA